MTFTSRDIIERIRDGWLRDAKSDYAGTAVRNALNIISYLTFIEPGQFILELLQNAEDARMELKRKGGEFIIRLYKDRCEILHNGKPFDEKDLKSLCNIGSRKKPREGYKGYIGIGWKSVYRVSDEVEIYSGNFSFKFSKRYWYDRAEWLRNKYGITPEQVPWPVVPIPIERAEYIPPDWTLFRIKFNYEHAYEDISRFLENIKSYMLLFLEYINRIVIEDKVVGSRRVYEWYLRSNGESINGVNIVKGILVDNGRASQFLVFKKKFKVPDDVKRDRFTRNAKRDDVDVREICIAFRLDDKDDPIPLEEARFWGVYSFLPLPESTTGLKFLIQADLIVHPGRRSVNYEAKWNAWLMECAAEVVGVAIDYFRKRKASVYLPVFEYEEVGGPFYERLLKPTVVRVIEDKLGDPLIPCICGKLVPLSKAVMFDEEVRDLIKEFGLIEKENELLKVIYGEEGLHLVSPEIKLRERDRARLRGRLRLSDLLMKEVIELFGEESIAFLAEVYKRLTVRWLPEGKRLVITESGKIVKASEAYLGEIPEDIKKLPESKEIPEAARVKIKEFLEKLNYVHKDFVDRVGKELLKELGVKEVTLQELCRKVLLPMIKTETKPPSRDEILAISMILKKAGVKPDSDIWAVDRKGEVRKASELYYPLDVFNPLEAYEELGVHFLGIKEYYGDGDWEKFFSEVARGLKRCYYYRPHTDYLELVRKLSKELEVLTEKEKLIQYTRMLRKLVEFLEDCDFHERLAINVVTDEGTIEKSENVYLHSAYKPEQDWYKWKNFYRIGSFISEEYLDEAGANAWRRFLTRYLGVRERASSEQIRDFAERYVKRKLEEKGYKILSEHGDGYDYEVEKDGQRILIEVKGTSRDPSDEELTPKETKKALDYRENYWVAVVTNIPNSPRIHIVKDPASIAIQRIRIPREQIEKGEKWD